MMDEYKHKIPSENWATEQIALADSQSATTDRNTGSSNVKNILNGSLQIRSISNYKPKVAATSSQTMDGRISKKLRSSLSLQQATKPLGANKTKSSSVQTIQSTLKSAKSDSLRGTGSGRSLLLSEVHKRRLCETKGQQSSDPSQCVRNTSHKGKTTIDKVQAVKFDTICSKDGRGKHVVTNQKRSNICKEDADVLSRQECGTSTNVKYLSTSTKQQEDEEINCQNREINHHDAIAATITHVKTIRESDLLAEETDIEPDNFKLSITLATGIKSKYLQGGQEFGDDTMTSSSHPMPVTEKKTMLTKPAMLPVNSQHKTDVKQAISQDLNQLKSELSTSVDASTEEKTTDENVETRQTRIFNPTILVEENKNNAAENAYLHPVPNTKHDSDMLTGINHGCIANSSDICVKGIEEWNDIDTKPLNPTTEIVNGKMGSIATIIQDQKINMKSKVARPQSCFISDEIDKEASKPAILEQQIRQQDNEDQMNQLAPVMTRQIGRISDTSLPHDKLTTSSKNSNDFLAPDMKQGMITKFNTRSELDIKQRMDTTLDCCSLPCIENNIDISLDKSSGTEIKGMENNLSDSTFVSGTEESIDNEMQMVSDTHPTGSTDKRAKGSSMSSLAMLIRKPEVRSYVVPHIIRIMDQRKLISTFVQRLMDREKVKEGRSNQCTTYIGLDTNIETSSGTRLDPTYSETGTSLTFVTDDKPLCFLSASEDCYGNNERTKRYPILAAGGSIIQAEESYAKKREKIVLHILYFTYPLTVQEFQINSFFAKVPICIINTEGNIQQFLYNYEDETTTHLCYDQRLFKADFKSCMSRVTSFKKFQLSTNLSLNDLHKVVVCWVIHIGSNAFYYVSHTEKSLINRCHKIHYNLRSLYSKLLRAKTGGVSMKAIAKKKFSDNNVVLFECALLLAYLEDYAVRLYVIDAGRELEKLKEHWIHSLGSRTNGFNSSE